ncbi:MAG: S8 family serine peptidase [Chloroherpetonaceae bacterium]
MKATTLASLLIVVFSLSAFAQPEAARFKANPSLYAPRNPNPFYAERTVQRELNIKFKERSTLDLQLRRGAQTQATTKTLRIGTTSVRYETSKLLFEKAKEKSRVGKVYALRLDSTYSESEIASILSALRNSPDLDYAEPVRLYDLDDWTVPNDSAFSEQWNLERVKAIQAWAITKGSPQVRIGIMDTGIDYTHPDLIPNLWINSAEDRNQNGTFEPWDFRERRNPTTFQLDPNGITGDFDGIDQDSNGYADDVIGYDFTDQPFNVDHLNGASDFQFPDPDPFDDNSHGTACAGIVAAATNNTIGVAGVAPNCKLVALRVFTAWGGFGSDFAADRDIATAIIYAADNNIRILNMSFGDVVLSPVVRDAVQYAYSRGVVMCASSGNAGGDQQRYPAGYDEVIAVGATTPFDTRTPFTTFGIRLDLCAPGVGINTTFPFYRGFYTSSFGGTSAAAPHAAGTAALLLSLRPNLTAEQVRGILVSTTDDIELEGWDHFTGSGRLNMLQALQSDGAPIAKILSPQTDEGRTAQSPIAVTGTAISPRFQSFTVDYRRGIGNQNQWITLATSTRPMIRDTLAIWNIVQPDSLLPNGDYTLRLAVRETTGRTIENRIRVVIDRTPPVIASLSATDVIVNDRHGVLVEFRTDDQCDAVLFYRQRNSSQPFSPFRFDGIRQRHSALLGENDLQPETDYDFFVQAKNLAGFITRSDTSTFRLNGFVSQIPTFGQTYLRERRDLRLPKGYFLKTMQDFNRNGRKEVLMNESRPFEGRKFGDLRRYEYNADSAKFILLDTLPLIQIPRSVADIDGDGRLELLTSAGGKTLVFSQSTPQGSPFETIRFADTTRGDLWGATFADTKNNGERQLLARRDTNYLIYNNAFQPIASLPNPFRSRENPNTAPLFEQPRAIVDDFDGDGKREIIVGDYDANFFGYEYSGSGNTYNLNWQYQAGAGFIGGSQGITSGNYLNNGKRQLIIGYHSEELFDSLRNYATPIWVYECWQANNQDSLVRIWKQAFFNYRFKRFFESAVATSDLDKDGVDELIIVAYPNLYIFKWDGARETFVPVWNYPFAQAQEVMVGDADGNGLNEIYFCDDLFSYAWEYQNFQGILAPVGVAGEPLGTNQIRLSWRSVQGATQYKIYRQATTAFPTYPFNVSLFATTTNTEFIDNSVNPNLFYVYAVTASDGISESDTSAYLIGRAVPLPRVLSASFANQSLRVRFNRPMSPPIQAGMFLIEKNGEVKIAQSVAFARGGEEAVLSFRYVPLDTGRYVVRVSGLRDIFNARLDTNFNTATFEVVPESQAAFFIVEKAVISPYRISLTMNRPIDPSSVSPQNFTVKPDGRVKAATVQNNKLLLDLEGRPIGALGFTVSLVVREIRSTDGMLIDTANSGNVVSFASTKENLADVFTYPNPYSKASGVDFIMFANLTRKATIHIYTLNGKAIKTIQHEGDTGGARWNLDTNSGEKVASGIYIYRITAEGVSEKMGKLAIVR